MFFTSDTHFYHTNIIKYTDRPFSSAEEMNEKLIENWNSVVSKNDIIYHLGDFAFCGSEKSEMILKQLNGNITLIPGNHDKNSLLNMFSRHHSVIREEGYYILHGKYKIFLTHRNNLEIQEENSFVFHGHEHGYNLHIQYETAYKNIKERFKNEKSFGVRNNTIEVGVDLWNYKPAHIDEIMKKLI